MSHPNNPSAQSLDTPGLITGLSGVARNLLGLILNRFQLAALELSSVRTNVVKSIALLIVAVFTSLFGLAFWSALVVYLCWDALGGTILLIMAVLFTGATIGIALYVRSLFGKGKLSIPATLAELRRDRDALL